MSQPLQHALPEHLAARQSAMRREWHVQIIGVVLAIVCMVGAGFLIGPINVIRKERQLVIDPDSIKSLPPDIALLGKLGTFRALAIDWASIRAERLKQEGKTYEAHQLHLTICRLAPRFAKMWANAAWNMAYNISVMKYSPEERWQWVQNGIRLIREEGLRYNPKSATLYKELAWIFWNKIGGYLDDEHVNYKKALAVEMERILGPPPVDTTEEAYFAWFRPIVDAPRDLDQLIEQDEAVSAIVDSLAGVNMVADESLLDFVARHLRPETRVKDLLRERPGLDPLFARRVELLTSATAADPLGRLLAAIRSQVLRGRYRFDLDFMMDLMENQYGPLDWRNGFAHALYWSSYGDHVSRSHLGSDQADKMNTARFIFFSLQSLASRGQVILWPDFDDPFDSYIELLPDIRFIPYLFDTYMRLGKEHFGDHPKFIEGTPGPNYMTGFVNNMHNWIELLYLEGGERNTAYAENLYAWLRENNPHPDGSTQERYLVPLELFVMGNAPEHLFTYKAIGSIIRSFVNRALKFYSLGKSKTAVTSLKRARLAYDTWMEDTRVDRNDRRKLQRMELILRDQIEDYIKSQRIRPLYKSTLWAHLPLQQRQMVYDRLRPYFEQLCQTQDPPWSLASAFPVPAGMEDFRRKQIGARHERRKDVDQGRLHKE